MIRFSSQIFLYFAIFAIPFMFIFFKLMEKSRKNALKLFGDPKLIKFLSASVNRGNRTWSQFFISLAVVLVLLSAARPQFGTRLEEIKREGIDLVIALDLSNSMYAEDVKPNRLLKAKYEIKKLVEMLNGDRIALVIFGGEAYLQCPLTLDYDAFLMLLNSVDPSSVPVQGTAIGKAIEAGSKAFVQGELKHKVMLLITDGEDHYGDPETAAEKAREQGIRIYTVGIGSPAGVPVPIIDAEGRKIGLKKDRQGNMVTTRLDEETLQRVSLATDGKYYPARPGHAELEAITNQIAGMDQKQLDSKKFTQYEDRFQYPLATAVFFMILATLLPQRRKIKGTLSDYVQQEEK